MRNHLVRNVWIVSLALLVVGVLFLFPQPFFTYYCSAYVCPTETSGGLSIGYLLIVPGALLALVAAIASLVTLAQRGAQSR